MRIFSVDAADPFLPTLAARIADGTLWPAGRCPDDPFALARVTVYLPTRRAARALAAAFLSVSDRPATVLPRIESLGGDDAAGADVIGGLEARVVLAALIRRWAALVNADPAEPDARVLAPASGADAIRLADELLALMDQVETQECDWADLPGLVERADLAEHWQVTTEFLKVATEMWPAFLAETGRISEAAARRRAAEAAAARVAQATGPMIVAGSTGSIPATRRLIRAIAESPWGAVVLPGFDRAADAEAWAALAAAPDAPGHPQYGMAELLAALDVAPHAVHRLAPPSAEPGLLALMSGAPRTAVLSAALRPAPDTHRWRADRAAVPGIAAALADVTLVDAPDEREEAAAIALAMRESVERGETVALVTPHRPLARRVRHALARWDIAADDSAGEPLSATPAGILARLVAAVCAGGSAAEWLALLKHPLARFGLEPAEVARVARAAERAFRGPRIAPAAAVAAIRDRAKDDAPLVDRVADALSPLRTLSGERTVAELAAAHHAAFAATAAGDGEAVEAILAALTARRELSLPARDWPATFDALLAGEVVRGRPDEAPVRILGPLEARLQSVDHAILGGLNEGTWPATADAGPWMSRGMMSAFGIDLPERRIGLSAHDFVMAAHNPRVTLTRARKAAGAPTLASRWWLRLLAFAGEDAAPALARGTALLDLARRIERRPAVPPSPRPMPAPPLAARPAQFSVTEIARLVRDPYAVYARRVLRLKPLDELEADPSAGDRGELVHHVMAEFIGSAGHRAPDAEARFAAIVDRALAERLTHAPEAKAVWGARLRAIAPELIATERARETAHHVTEIEATAEVAPGLTLRGRTDRIDVTAGGAQVIDYKTGGTPSKEQVKNFFEPQLPLEAVLIRLGAVRDVPADIALTGLAYVKLCAGRVPVEWKPVAGDDAGDLAAEALDRLRKLLALYADPSRGYLSRARLMFEAKFDGDFDHLARAAEWGA